MVTNLAFKLVGKEQALIMVPVYANEQGPFDFVFDTGAGMTILHAELAERLHIREGETKEAMGAGGKVNVFLSQLESLALSSARQDKLGIAVTDLSQLSQAIQCKVDGIVGYNFLKHFCIQLNYEKNSLTLLQSQKNLSALKRPMRSPSRSHTRASH
jgi:predicted aspartyl protease